MRFLLGCSCFFLLPSLALAESQSRGAQELLGFFGSQCVVSGTYSSEALSHSQALIRSLESIARDPDCRTVSGVIGQLRELESYSYRLSVTPSESRILELERVEDELNRALQAASPELSREIQFRLLETQEELARLSAQVTWDEEDERLRRRRQTMISFASGMQALLSQTSANMACWSKHPSVLQSIGQLASSVMASSRESEVALPLQGLVHLTGSILEAARTMRINRSIREVAMSVRKNAYICTLEKLSNAWCSAYEGQEALRIEKTNRNTKNVGATDWMGLSLLNRELNVLNGWLANVRSGSQPSSLDIGEQKATFYKREEVVLSTEAKGLGLLRESYQLWNSLKGNRSRVWTFEKKLITDLVETVFPSRSFSMVAESAPTRERYDSTILPYYLLGFFDNPSSPIPVPQSAGVTLSFGSFDPLLNSYPGFNYAPDLVAIERRFSVFIQEAKQILESERAVKVELEPATVLDDFISDGRSLGLPSPQTSTKRLVEFLKAELVSPQGLPPKYRITYSETINRLEKILAEVDAYYSGLKPASDALKEVYASANLLAGTRALTGPIERAIRISLNTRVLEAEQPRDFLNLRLMAAQSVVDQLQAYTGRESLDEMYAELNNTMSISQANILNFTEFFGEEIQLALQDYDRLARLSQEDETGPNRMMKAHLCMLVATNNSWPKSIPFELCRGVRLSSLDGEILGPVLDAKFLNQASMEPARQRVANRVCAVRDFYRRTRILNREYRQLY